MANRIDELNSPKEFDSEEYIENFFKPMPISEDRKEERKEASRDFLDFLLFILALISTESEYGALDWAYIEDQFRKEIERVSLMYADESKALNDYLDDKTDDFIQTTQRHDLSDPYWTSEERATKEAVNEANSVVGLSELQRAALRGAVKKQWRTERDNRVRLTHQLVDGKSVALDRMFQVGEALMRYPCDFYHSVRESVNCRCGLDYLDENGKVILVGKRRNGEEVNKTDEKVQFTDGETRDTLGSRIRGEIEYFLSNNRGGAIGSEEQQRRARETVGKRIESGRYSLFLSEEKYLEHVEGTPQFINTMNGRKGRKPSRLNISYEEAQQIIEDYSSKGTVQLSGLGKVMDVEYVTLEKNVGDIWLGDEWIPTRRIAIHHGKDYSHIVPVKENPKYE